MKNICFLNTVSFWGGGEKLHLDNALWFKKAGYNVIVASRVGSPLYSKTVESNIPTFGIALSNFSLINPFKHFKLQQFFKEKNIDTIVISGSTDIKFGGLVAKMAGVKNIVYLRGLARPIRNTFFNRFLFNRVITHPIANSEETKSQMAQKMGDSIDKNKIKVIYHGITVDEFKGIGTYDFSPYLEDEDCLVLGNAGRLTSQKGQTHLIEIAKILKQRGVVFKLFIAGEGDMEDELQQLITENGLDNDVILLGFVDRMKEFMNGIDVFLLSSLYEGFGFVIVEAMICKKPVVAFNVSSNPEIISDLQTGYLAEFPEYEKFADAVERLALDKSLRSRIGDAGYKSVNERFTLSDRNSELESYLLAQ